jgi:uncharacterized protein
VITDFHTHAFPDPLADRAIRTLEAETDGVKAKLDGRVSSLLASMDRAGIDRSVICSIATRPEQFDPILAWSSQIASERIVPFPSIHPRDPQARERIRRIRQTGFLGVKMHPYYQDFFLDEEALFPLYEEIVAQQLIFVCHTGFDIAFPRIRRCDPIRISRVVTQFPLLTLVATHLGAWEDWAEVRRHLLGRPIHMEISFSLEMLAGEEVRDLLLRHPAEHLLFGTDSPWQDQGEALARFRALGLGWERERAAVEANADRLLAASAAAAPRF